ncbi:MAG: metallophosphoesterase family protein [Candidatus Limnocylindria bacterium]
MPSIEPFRFLHTGDLHLDSPFAGLTGEAPPAVAASLRLATLESWKRIVDLALEEGVDFVVVAGDVFEHANRTLLAQVRFRDGLARLAAAGIPSFVVTGNHDPLSGWEAAVAWPELAHRFPADEVESRPVARDGREICRVYGISYGVSAVTENLSLRFRRDASAPFTVGLLHANVRGQPGHQPYAPCTIADLRRSGIDYWALGHVHKPGILSTELPTVVYCGNPQGRDPGEAEPRGCWIVDVDAGGRATPRFHEADAVRWRLLTVPIDELDGEEALIAAIVDRVEAARAEAGRSIVARVTLVGRGALHASLQRASLPAELRQLAQERLGDGEPFAWIESLRDATRPAVDLATAGAPGTFLGELLIQADDAREAVSVAPPPGEPLEDDAGEEAAAGLIGWEEVLDELYGHHRARRYLRDRRPGPERLAELLGDAERLAVDRLLEAG